MAEQLPLLALRVGKMIGNGSRNRSLFTAAHALRSATESSGLHPVGFTGQVRSYADYPAHALMGMPALSPTMTQGNIGKWRKKEGEHVAAGQILAEIETDKATMEWEAQEDGYVAKLLLPEGAKDIAVGAPALVMVDEEESVGAFANYVAGAAPAKPTAAAPSAAAAPAAAPASNFPPHQLMTMPALSPTMTQGNILEWKKKVGDHVAPGEIYCEVETDKATMAWEAQEEGYIAQVLVPSGTKDLNVGTPVIVVVEEKSDVDAFASFTAANAASADAPAAASPSAPAAPAAAPSSPATAPAALVPKAPVAAAHAASGERVRASPYARKVAAQAGVPLAGIAGTGPGGIVVAQDVHDAVASGEAVAGAATTTSAPARAAAAAAGVAAAPSASTFAPVTDSGASYVDVPHSQIRRVTAQRLMESKQTIPHYYLTVECQVDSMMKLRSQINEASSKSGVKISVNDFVLKAAALALKKVPGVNSTWQPDFIRQYNNVDISVAVQTPTGLMTPIVKDADLKGLSTISSDVKSLAGKAKEGRLSPAEFMGGTFTISNLGMYGVKQFCAIVNPPQAAILAVGGSDKKVILNKAGAYVEVTTMHVTLSCDHRVIDGAMGAEWLAAFRSYIEEPYTMML